jgi:phosphonate transport system substrate-binding protein
LSPSHGASAPRQAVETFGRLVAESAGLAVEVVVAPDPVTAIEAVGARRADLALLNLAEYLLAREESRVEPRLQVLRAGEPADAYFGAIVVRADSDIQDPAGLAGKRVAFTDGYSVSGFLYAAVALRDVKLGGTELAGSHERALALLKAGKVDAAATYEEAVAADPELRVIKKTDAIPNEPVVVRRGLDEDVANKMLAALVALPGTPAGAEALAGIAHIRGFQAVDARAYEPTVDALRAAGRTAEDMVPGGRAMVMFNHPVLGGDPR